MGQAHGKKAHGAQNGSATAGLGANHQEKAAQQSPQPAAAAPPGGLAGLSDRQKFLVRQTWDIARGDMERVGFTTFHSVFEEHQDLKKVFVESWGMSEDDVDDDRLLSHGLRVASIINQVVENIDDAAKIDSILADLGQRHVNYNVMPEMIPIIGIRFLASFQPMLEEESLWTSEIQLTWNLIIDHITNVMSSCLRTGIAKRESSPAED